LYFTRPEQIVLCMNERSLLAVIVPFREARTLGVRFCDAATGWLARIGVPPQAVAAESAAMGEVAFGATANRKVLGCLNEAAFELGAESSLGRRLFGSLAEMEDHLSENIYSTTGYRRPRDLATELLAAASVSFGTH
jgi:hypothetical protein